ncbi:hypothetical protein CPB84DRAFT_1815939 [Gymnopilus junonius]|uniref:Uncharacterized protein n=1 Tax=Gymnopilus junonius TaxID=109634 RepID=A0A9P5NLD4_GYMJU|nr:hypothetical protein CPB84DRAFT_1815939 [Gymnopilus junonius]
MNSSNGSQRNTTTRYSPTQRSRVPSIHWLFRSNIPRKRASYISLDVQKRNFFGMGEIIGVIANPAETVRSLTESRKMLEDARREINENKERSQLRPKHTFSKLPGFFPRKAEMLAIERALDGEPSFTVLFGASSVGKTALLREVLTRDAYHVLHFDLRIAGFADLPSLYMSLSQQMEQYFEGIAKIEGYEVFEKEAWGFKHDHLNVERRFKETNVADSKSQTIKTSDIARLMELFQSSLLKYCEFQPETDNGHDDSSKDSSKPPRRQASADTDRTHIDHASDSSWSKSRWGLRSWGKTKASRSEARHTPVQSMPAEKEKGKAKERPPKKIPVIFFDEAHKLPALIQSTETMKCILDSMLVLTKQDRLCHVIHATSDPFYQTWLRQLNVMQHCKSETRKFFRERLLPRVPEGYRPALNFEVLYDAFGGKLAHWHDYITDYINSNGTMDIKQSSHFLQAHALLNLHIIHSSQAPTGGPTNAEGDQSAPGAANASTADTLHPGLGPAGFKIYSPLAQPQGHGSMSSDSSQITSLGGPPEFSAMELLKVMSRFARPDTQYLPYFHLCRELGVRTVDGMVKGRVLDLRWTEPVTKENGEGARRSTVIPTHARDSRLMSATSPSASGGVGTGTSSGGFATAFEGSTGNTPIDPPPPIDDEEVMIPVGGMYDEVLEVVGPKLVPTTPIMRYAMRDVVQEYEDDQSVSEYASLSDVDEY